MAKFIASIADGREVPWFSEDPVPQGYVVVPPELHAKFVTGEIADGIALAKAALVADAEVGTAPANASVEPPPAPAPKRKAVKAAASEKVEPGFPSVANFPPEGTMRA